MFHSPGSVKVGGTWQVAHWARPPNNSFPRRARSESKLRPAAAAPSPVSAGDAAATIDGLHMDESPSSLPDPEHQAFAGELRRMLEAAVESLPESYRVVFVLREVEGLSTTDTAECLEINEDTVKTRLHRARGLLRDDLSARAGAATAEAFQFHAAHCDRIVAGVLEQIAGATPSLPADHRL
jgi:RNA polymerase sigma-70 factor (ECF subfamily)